jgi:hypothetical protein
MMEWKTRVVNHPSSSATDIYIFRDRPDGYREYVTNLSGEAGIEVKSIKEGTRMEPAIKMDWDGEQMLQSISDGLFDFGIRPKQEPILQNELTATKYHLSDMRDMVCIVSGIKKGEDFGKDREDGAGVAQRSGSKPHQ